MRFKDKNILFSGGGTALGRVSRLAFSLCFLACGIGPLASGLYSQTELGSEDDLTVKGVDGTMMDPDVEIKGFSLFGSTGAAQTVNIPQTPGNIYVSGFVQVSSGAYFIGGSTFTTGGAYFQGISSFSTVGKIYIPGANDATKVLKSNLDGSLVWAADSNDGGASLNGTANRLIKYQSDGSGVDASVIQQNPTNVGVTLMGSSMTVQGELGASGAAKLGSTLDVTGAATMNGNAYLAVSGGSVGIGTASPGARLEVTDATYPNPLKYNPSTSVLSISGPVATLAQMPRMQYNFNGDADAALGYLMYNHDNLAISLDSYHNGSNWISSDLGSNFALYKTGDELVVGYNAGTAKGSSFGGFNLTGGARFSKDGKLGLGSAVSAVAKLEVAGNIFITGNPADNRYLAIDETNTGTTQLILQAGAGSAAFGGGLSLYGHSHASYPGWVKAGISSGSGGKFSVNTQGTGTGTDVFTVDAIGNGYFAGNVGVGIAAPGAKFEVTGGSTSLNGDLGVSGVTKLNGAVNLGDAATDLLTMTAQGTFIGGSTFTTGGVYFTGISSFSTVGKIYIPGANDTTKVLKSNLDGSLVWAADSNDGGASLNGTANRLIKYQSDGSGVDASVIQQNPTNVGVTLMGSSMTVQGELGASGAAKLGSTLNVTGAATLSGNAYLAVSGGSVGIGTASPGYDLDIWKTIAGDVAARIRNDSTSALADSTLVFNASGNSWALSEGSSAKNSNRLDLIEDWNSAKTIRVSVAVGGNVGIGTATPGAKFEVTGGSTSLNGDLGVSGVTKLNGAVNLGDAATDLLTMTAQGTFIGGSTFTTGGAYFQGISSFSTVGKIYIPGANDTTKVLKSNLDGSLVWAADSNDGGASLNGTANRLIKYQSDGSGVDASVIQQNPTNVGVTLMGSSMTVQGELGASGAAKLGSTLDVTGAAALSNNLTVSGVTALNGAINLGDAAADLVTIRGPVTVMSASSITVQGDFGANGVTKLNGAINLGDAVTDLLTMTAQGTFIGGSTFTTGGAYFTGISSFSTVGKIYIPGANDTTKVLKSNLDGSLVWAADSNDGGASLNGTANRLIKYQSDGSGVDASVIQQNPTNVGVTLMTSSMTVQGELEVAGFTRTYGIRTSAMTTGAEMVYLRGTGANNSANRVVKVGTSTYVNAGGRGLTLVVLTAATHALVSVANYDTYGDAAASNNLATALNNLTRDKIGTLTSYDAWEGLVTDNLRTAARRLGLFKLGGYYTAGGREPYAAMFYGSGTGTGNTEPGRQAIEIIESSDVDAPYALVATWLTEDGFTGPSLPSALISPDAVTSEPVVFVRSDGNVGIGTTVPGAKFEVTGGSTSLNGDLGVAGVTKLNGVVNLGDAATDLLTMTAQGTFIGGSTFTTGGAYFTGVSSFSTVGKIYIPGANDTTKVLKSNLDGSLVWAADSNDGGASLNGTANRLLKYQNDGNGVEASVLLQNPAGTALKVVASSVTIDGTGGYGLGVTGATALNGNTSISGANTFTVGTGLASLGGALTVTGISTLSGSQNFIGPITQGYPFQSSLTWESDHTGYYYGFGYQQNDDTNKRLEMWWIDTSTETNINSNLNVAIPGHMFDGAAPNSGRTIGARIVASGVSYFNGGNVGVGITTPGAKFEVTGGSASLNGDLGVSGVTKLNGAVNLGDAATDLLTMTAQGTFIGGSTFTTGGAYFQGISSFSTVGKIYIPGANDTTKVLKSNLDGSLVWAADSNDGGASLNGTANRLIKYQSDGSGVDASVIQQNPTNVGVTLMASSMTVQGELGASGAVKFGSTLNVTGSASGNYIAHFENSHADGHGVYVKVNNSDTNRGAFVYDNDTGTQVYLRNDGALGLGYDYSTMGTGKLQINGNVGIGTTTPGAKLDVNGVIRSSGSYYNVLSWHFNSSITNGVKIKTNLPYVDDSQMPTVILEGYDYGTGGPVGIALVWYIYSGNFYAYKASSFGNSAPVIKLANESGKVTINLAWTPYFGRMTARVFSQGLSDDPSWFNGWTVVDEAPGAVNQVTVAYSNTFPGKVNFSGGIWDSNGRVGIGTTSPNQTLEVRRSDAEQAAIFVGTDDTTLTIGDNAAGNSGEQYVTYRNVNTGANGWMTGMDDDSEYKIAYGALGEIAAGNILVTVLRGGNVGVGIAAPGAKFEVTGGSTSLNGDLGVSGVTKLNGAVNLGDAATDLLTMNAQGTFIGGSTFTTGGAYFTGISSFSTVGKIYIPGANDTTKVLKSNLDGSLVWAADSNDGGASLNGTANRLIKYQSDGSGVDASVIQQNPTNVGVTLMGSSMTVQGELGASGATKLGSTLDVTGAAALSNNLTVSGVTALNGAINLGDAAADLVTIRGPVTVMSASSITVQGDFGANGVTKLNGAINLGDAVTDLLTMTAQGTFIGGSTFTTGGAYFTGISSFSNVGSIYVAGGATGNFLAKAAGGVLQWTAVSGDNLGNHLATMLLTANFGVKSSTAVNAGYYQIAGSTVLAILPGDGTSLSVGAYAGVTSTTSGNTFVGYYAGNTATKGKGETFIGAYSGQVNTGDDNTFVGENSGQANVAGVSNTFIGEAAGYSNIGGSWNTFVGNVAGQENTTGDDNVFVGQGAGLANTGGSENTYLGANAGAANTTGGDNVFVGAGAGAANDTAGGNTFVGLSAGGSVSTGGDNIFLGWHAGYSVTTGTGNIVIGHDLNPTAANSTNEINIGGVYKGNVSSGTATIGKYTVEANNAGITVDAADLGKTITVNSASAQVITLPTFTANDVGGTITVVKLNTGKVTIDAPAGTYIEDSTSGGTIYNNATSPYFASITLRLITATQWILVSGEGAWITS